jgi:hypothetical protein
MSYKITARIGPKVEREQADALEQAIEHVKRYVRGARRRETVSALGRAYAPGDQVAVRIEVKGNGRHAGLDVRGDGSLVAYRGRFVRRVVEHDDPYEALRRALTA